MPDILPNRKTADLIRYFRRFDNRKDVKAVWAMENAREAEQKALPARWRKFCKHSKRLMSKPRSALTPEEDERLRILLGLSGRLERACDLKNDFLEFLHSPDSAVGAK